MNENICLAISVIIVAVAGSICYYYGRITKQNVMEWLLYAVTEAERLLGSGTGKFKLRMVYNWFISNYPILSRWVSFETFSVWVDMALEQMRIMLEDEKIAAYVGVKAGEVE
jgi:hypothetical protein